MSYTNWMDRFERAIVYRIENYPDTSFTGFVKQVPEDALNHPMAYGWTGRQLLIQVATSYHVTNEPGGVTNVKYLAKIGVFQSFVADDPGTQALARQKLSITLDTIRPALVNWQPEIPDDSDVLRFLVHPLFDETPYGLGVIQRAIPPEQNKPGALRSIIHVASTMVLTLQQYGGAAYEVGV